MSGKASLLFILNPVELPVVALLELHTNAIVPSLQSPSRVSHSSCTSSKDHCHPLSVAEKRFVPIRPKAVGSFTRLLSPFVSTDTESAVDDEDDQHKVLKPSAPRKRKTTKKTKLCKEEGCTSLAVSRRSCVRHGGGSRCIVDGCTNGAKLRNKCFQHGGSTICLADGCDSKSKRYGYCWCHGGGRICSNDGCDKVAAQGGLCWAHGGGNRCRLDGCIKRSYQKHGYYCKRHATYNTP